MSKPVAEMLSNLQKEMRSTPKTDLIQAATKGQDPVLLSEKLSLGPSKSPNNIRDTLYLNHQYPDDHWALKPTAEGTAIVYVQYRNTYNYLVKLNPTDKRGYRCLVTYMGTKDSDLQSTFNRPYTAAEQKGLSEVTTLIIEIYKLFGLPIVQSAQAGNNSQCFIEKTSLVQIGNTKEPSQLHTHVWGRGDPKYNYIPKVALEGPLPGQMFDMMAKTPSVPGNEKKVLWEAHELQIALNHFKECLKAFQSTEVYKQEFSELKVDMVTIQQKNTNYRL